MQPEPSFTDCKKENCAECGFKLPRLEEAITSILAIKLGGRTLKEWIELYEKGKLRIEADDQILFDTEKYIPTDWNIAYRTACQDILTPDSEGKHWVKVLP